MYLFSRRIMVFMKSFLCMYAGTSRNELALKARRDAPYMHVGHDQ